MVEIDLNHIYRKYEGNSKYPVSDFDLHIKDKEFIVFIGPPSCGKSVISRMAADLEDISKGILGIDHKVVNNVAPKDRSIVTISRNYTLYLHMSIHGSMVFRLKLRRYEKDEVDKRVEHVAEILGLSEYLDKKPLELPGGQKRRVTLGRAAVRDAPIFLMDEPLSNLDTKLRVTMYIEIAKSYQNLGTTIIYVTHDQTEAMTLADRVVVMPVGRAQQVGTLLEVHDKPVDMFTAGFIGSLQMNFFNVHFKGGRISDGRGLNIEISGGRTRVFKDKGYEGKGLVSGIRSGDVRSEKAFPETWPNQTVKSTAAVSGLLGSTIQLYQEVDNTELVAIVNVRNHHTPGDKIEMGLGVNKAHFSSKDTTNAIR